MKRKKARYEKTVLFLIVVIVIITISFLYIFSIYVQPDLVPIPELSTEGFTEVLIGLNTTDDMGYIYLEGGCYELSMIINKAQAESIEGGIMGIIQTRPNTHDLVKDMLKNLKANILMIKIVELKDDAYHARLILRKDNLILSLDSRPSDAIAIAARTEYTIPIYVNESLLKSYGSKIC